MTKGTAKVARLCLLFLPLIFAVTLLWRLLDSAHLEVEMLAESGNAAQLFWGQGEESFTELRSVTLPIRPGTRAVYSFNLPPSGPDELRLDPTNAPGRVRIFRVTLKLPGGKISHSAKAELRNALKAGGNVSLSAASDALELHAADSDPAVVINLPPELRGGRWSAADLLCALFGFLSLLFAPLIRREWVRLRSEYGAHPKLALWLGAHNKAAVFACALFASAALGLLIVVLGLNIFGKFLPVPFLALNSAAVLGSLGAAFVFLALSPRLNFIGEWAARHWKAVLIVAAALWCLNLNYLGIGPIYDISISRGAFDFVMHGKPCNAPMDYYPHLSSVYLLYCLLFLAARLFGLHDFTAAYWILLLFNAICLLLTAQFTFKALQETCSKSAAGLTLLLMCAYLPWIVYCTLPYTDTLLLFLLPLAVLRFIRRGYQVDWLVLLVMLPLVCLKPNYLWFLAALILVSMQRAKFSQAALQAALAIGILAFSVTVPPRLLVAITKEPLIPSWEITPWHYLNMGHEHPFGAYNEASVAKTNSLPGAQAKNEYNRREFIAKVEARGVLGEAHFLLTKLNYIWADPDLYAVEKLRLAGPNEKFADKFFKQSILVPLYTNLRLHYAALPHHMLIVLSMVLAGLWRRREPFAQFCLLSILFTTLFILAWEARSRYLMVATPVMFMLVGQALDCARRPLEGTQLAAPKRQF